MATWLQQCLLVALPLTPALGALAGGLCPQRAVRTVRAIGWTCSVLTLAAWVVLRAVLPGGAGLLVSVHVPWVAGQGIGLHLGLDSTGALMAGMISFVGVVAVVGTLPTSPALGRSHIVFLLLAEAGMLGVVTSWDLILFIAFWEVTLIPFFFLMGRGPTRGGVSAASRFFVISVTSSVLMWVGVLMLVEAAGQPRTFDLAELVQRLRVHPIEASTAMWLFVPAFLVRMAAVPLHTWFPIAAANVPTAAGILLAGGVLPLGGYGLVHVFGRLFGDTPGDAHLWLGWIGLVTGLAGSLASLVQRDLKRLLAHVCLAQIGLSVVGLMTAAPGGRYGALLLLVGAGLGGAALFLFAGVICQARGSQRLVDIAGLWRASPFFAGLAFAGVASAAAVPGTLGFVGAALVLRSLAGDPVRIVLAAGAWLVVGASVLWAYRRVLGGSFQPGVWANERWPRKRQVTILGLIALVVVAAGIMPGLIAPVAGGAP